MDVAFTERELDVMTVLWDRGPATVAEVRERLADPLAYTTVLSVLRTLEAKGYAGHAEEGRAHRYHALVDRAVAGRSALQRLLGTVFGGSPELLLTNLMETRGADAAELERLRRVLDAHASEEER
ncbi:BlaI/MecI/CopY family transcriptional regulator [Roseisolibacter sp. H3M3-2]|uniref:BlaI/MecI/CopY family transcriptional regulator n=1 Tax=Roseisolibacter sp. H3M3-2 TaxID=3031323 RepID=UPI0023DAFFEF|nr:BlaI/MecI/CopY family transcriptional regulator [Roseisolibacter sp. H3M3-2]MDF1504750.1 BlaI/MecI/CopY family transcriptional regulator [Roseisolibacter sp. H3M3-2]